MAHVYEDWETPINSKLSSIAEISRIDIDEEVDKAIREEIDAANKEIDDMEAGIKEAAAEKKAGLRQKITNLKAKNAARKEGGRTEKSVQKPV